MSRVWTILIFDMPNDSAYDSICTLCSRKGAVAQGADSDRSQGSSSTGAGELTHPFLVWVSSQS